MNFRCLNGNLSDLVGFDFGGPVTGRGVLSSVGGEPYVKSSSSSPSSTDF